METNENAIVFSGAVRTPSAGNPELVWLLACRIADYLLFFATVAVCAFVDFTGEVDCLGYLGKWGASGVDVLGLQLVLRIVNLSAWVLETFGLLSGSADWCFNSLLAFIKRKLGADATVTNFWPQFSFQRLTQLLLMFFFLCCKLNFVRVEYLRHLKAIYVGLIFLRCC